MKSTKNALMPNSAHSIAIQVDEHSRWGKLTFRIGRHVLLSPMDFGELRLHDNEGSLIISASKWSLLICDS